MKDFVDEIVLTMKSTNQEKICIACEAPNDPSYKTCKVPNCSGLLTKVQVDYSTACQNKEPVKPAEHFDGIVKLNQNSISVKVGEPDFYNPNSYESISQILRNRGVRAGVSRYGGDKREWLLLEADGAIYLIVEQLIFNVYRCEKCETSFYGDGNFKQHRCYILGCAICVHEFDWIIPLPGTLHIEMNACKAFVGLNWDVFMMSFAEALGFRSPKALEYIRKCSDHYKTWRLLEITYIAVADELLVPYVRHCLQRAEQPTAKGYWSWINDVVVGTNYIYLQQMIFTFLQAVMFFRCGVRNCDAEAVQVATDKLSALFFGRNHPNYKRIMSVDKYVRTMMPSDLKQVVASSVSQIRTGNTGHYQGADACLEEINKLGETWVSSNGVPTEDDWLRAFRNADKLDQVSHFRNYLLFGLC